MSVTTHWVVSDGQKGAGLWCFNATFNNISATCISLDWRWVVLLPSNHYLTFMSNFQNFTDTDSLKQVDKAIPPPSFNSMKYKSFWIYLLTDQRKQDITVVLQYILDSKSSTECFKMQTGKKELFYWRFLLLFFFIYIQVFWFFLFIREYVNFINNVIFCRFLLNISSKLKKKKRKKKL